VLAVIHPSFDNVRSYPAASATGRYGAARDTHRASNADFRLEKALNGPEEWLFSFFLRRPTNPLAEQGFQKLYDLEHVPPELTR
jgi:hypothetical protein